MKLLIAVSTIWACVITLGAVAAASAIVPIYDGTNLRKYSDLAIEHYLIGPREFHTKRPKEANKLSQDMGRPPTVPETFTRLLYYGLPAVAVVAVIGLATLSCCLYVERGRNVA
jgi:hypothetical protein